MNTPILMLTQYWHRSDPNDDDREEVIPLCAFDDKLDADKVLGDLKLLIQQMRDFAKTHYTTVDEKDDDEPVWDFNNSDAMKAAFTALHLRWPNNGIAFGVSVELVEVSTWPRS